MVSSHFAAATIVIVPPFDLWLLSAGRVVFIPATPEKDSTAVAIAVNATVAALVGACAGSHWLKVGRPTFDRGPARPRCPCIAGSSSTDC